MLPWSMGLVVVEVPRHCLRQSQVPRGDLRAFLTLADLHAQLTSRQHTLVSRAFQYGNVEEGVTRALSQLNEPEPFFGIEPFDGGVHRWARRDRTRARSLLKWLARALLIGPGIHVVIVKPTAPLAPVLSSSHVAKLVLFQSQWLMGPGTCERFSLQFLTMLG